MKRKAGTRTQVMTGCWDRKGKIRVIKARGGKGSRRKGKEKVIESLVQKGKSKVIGIR